MMVFPPIDTLWVFGVLSGILSLVAFLPYINDTIAGRTQPQRASWFIWSVLGAISFATIYASGATASLGFVGVQVSGTILIFVLSLWRGTGTLLRGSDCKVLFAAGLGLLLWHLTDRAVYALSVSIGISLLGGLVTIAKAYNRPSSETVSFWVWSGVSAAFALAAAGSSDPMMLAYPAYILGLNIAIVTAIGLGRPARTPIPEPILRAIGPALTFAQHHGGADISQPIQPRDTPRRHLREAAPRLMW